MSISWSICDTAAVIQMCVHACRRLEFFHQTEYEGRANELGKAVRALREAFGDLYLEQRDNLQSDRLDEHEFYELGKITKVSIDSIDVVLRAADPVGIEIGRCSNQFRRRKAPKISPLRMLLLPKQQRAINSHVTRLNSLLQRRRARPNNELELDIYHLPIGCGPPADSSTRHSQPEFAVDVSRRRPPASAINKASSDFVNSWCFEFSWPRSCVLIMTMFAIFIGLSCLLGIYFTVEKNYGYSMGDAFTLASYVIAVGALISSGVFARHYPRCKCWEPPTHNGDATVDAHELEAFVELPG